MPQVGYLPRQSANISGVVAPGAVLRFYQTGSSTPQNAYTDAALSNAVTSLTADAAGLLAKWYLNPNAAADYRYTLETSAGVVYYTEDGISRVDDNPKAAEDVTLADTDGLFTASNVEDALAEVDGRVSVLRATRGVFAAPAAFTHRAGDILYRRRFNGEAELITDLTPFMPPQAFSPFEGNWTRYYVDPDDGSDSNNGSTWALALKSITTALAKSDVDVVICKGGTVYEVTSGTVTHMGTYSGTRDVAVIAVGPRAIMASSRPLTYTEHATLANVWESGNPSGTIVKVIDTRSRDEYGDYVELTNVADTATVDTTPGSWFYDSVGTSLKVRLSDDTEPDSAEILALRQVAQRVEADDVRFYIENFQFIGGSSGSFGARNATEETYVTAKNCWFTHQNSGEGLQVLDCGMFISIDCRASKNANDGFNYHEANGISPHFIEINCVGLNHQGSTSTNGSTAHENVRGIRMNCDYYANSGPGIADINTSKTLNINVTSRDNSGSATSRGINTQDTAEAWVDGGAFAGNAGSDVYVNTGSTIHIRDAFYEDSIVLGTLDEDFT